MNYFYDIWPYGQGYGLFYLPVWIKARNGVDADNQANILRDFFIQNPDFSTTTCYQNQAYLFLGRNIIADRARRNWDIRMGLMYFDLPVSTQIFNFFQTLDPSDPTSPRIYGNSFPTTRLVACIKPLRLTGGQVPNSYQLY